MDIEELVVIYKKEKEWISRRLSTIDSLLDRAAYGNANDEKELIEEYDRLEQRMKEIRQVADKIGKVNELNRMINLIEDNIDSLACFVGNNNKIENLYKEIDIMEKQKDALLNDIAKNLNVDDKKQENTKKR